MEIPITIETRDEKLGHDLFDRRILEGGKTEKVISAGVSIMWDGMTLGSTSCTAYSLHPEQKTRYTPDIHYVIIRIRENTVLPAAVSSLSRYLYDKVKERAEKITINNLTIKVNPEEIEEVISMIIKRKADEARANEL